MSIEYFISKALKKLRLKAVKDSKIDKTAHVASGCHIYKSSIGKYTSLSYDCQLIHCRIGAFCSLASGIIIGGASHPMDWISTSQVFISEPGSIRKKFNPHNYESYKDTIIGNDVWIGDRVLIKAGVNIGDGAVIGMGSVVTKNIGAYEIWAGNPARFIRKRFDDSVIAELQNINLSEIPDNELLELAKHIDKPFDFIMAYNSRKVINDK